jgi:hypothetical protein
MGCWRLISRLGVAVGIACQNPGERNCSDASSPALAGSLPPECTECPASCCFSPGDTSRLICADPLLCDGVDSWQHWPRSRLYCTRMGPRDYPVGADPEWPATRCLVQERGLVEKPGDYASCFDTTVRCVPYLGGGYIADVPGVVYP